VFAAVFQIRSVVMNKSELVAKVAEKTKITHAQAEHSVNALLGTIEEALRNGEKVSLVGFGSFDTHKRKARTGRNPKSGAPIKIPAKTVVKFKPGSKLVKKIK
jgi:DNA-binding protein HU-beta